MPSGQPTIDLRRDHDDPYAHALSALAVDRQRVIHAAAFRRLQHKTQVFLSAGGESPAAGASAGAAPDHFRSRLTHTLEVANLARLFADRLALCADLAEVAALAHDLGHPPFGHAGERALNACLSEFGGFEHNAHTLRVVTYLEHPYPEFRGLNLTAAVRACLAGHTTRYDRPADPPDVLPIESSVVDLADRLAYALHDLQDGLYAGLIAIDALAELPLWQACYAGPLDSPTAWRGHLRPAIDRMQQTLVDRIALSSNAPTAALDPAGEALLAPLETLLRDCLYRHPALRSADALGDKIVRELFAAYVARPEQLPARFARRIEQQGAARVVADYLAGMTDRYCLAAHHAARAGT